MARRMQAFVLVRQVGALSQSVEFLSVCHFSQVLHRIIGLDLPAIPELQELARLKLFVSFGRVIVKLFEMKARLRRIRVTCQRHKEPLCAFKVKTPTS